MSDAQFQGLLRERLRTQGLILGSVLAAMWGIELLDYLVLGERLNGLGIPPRTLNGLLCIPAAPFLHGGPSHLAANTLPFLVLGGLVMLRSTRDFFAATAVIVLISGLAVWTLGRSGTAHLGASSLILGYFGFLLTRAFLERTTFSLVIAVAVGIFYGSLIWGIFPYQADISWESHLFGLIGGAVAARLLAARQREQPAPAATARQPREAVH